VSLTASFADSGSLLGQPELSCDFLAFRVRLDPFAGLRKCRQKAEEVEVLANIYSPGAKET
jgi:hypothetical protein